MSAIIRLKAYNDPEKGLIYFKPLKLKEFLETNTGETIDITMEVHDPEASPNQHAYYRVINRWLKNQTNIFGGWPEDEISSHAIDECGSETTIRYVGDKTISFTKRINLRTASKTAMNEFLNKWIEYLYTKHDIVVPPPKLIEE